MKMRRSISFLLCLVMVLSMLPVTPLTASAAYDEAGTTYVRVNSLEDIVPNARYIVIGEYAAEGVETDYFAMSNSTNSYDDYRVGLTALTGTDETSPNFVMAEDKQSLVLHSDAIMKIRLRAYTYGKHEDLYRMEVDGGYLYGFCNHYYYYGTSCCRELAVQQYSKGKYFWHFRMGGNGYWQISTYLDSSSSDMVSLAFNEVYADFMSYLYADNVRLDAEEYFFNTYISTDRDTNIWLYREVCSHKAEEVTHVEAKAATCTQAGNPEYWFCAGCEQYSTKADFSNAIAVADTLIVPVPHTDTCGHESKTARFEVYKDSSMSSDQAGEYYLLIGKAGEKYYAMGNVTNPDGSRNAVEVTVNANGIISAESTQAEFLEYYWPENGGSIGFLADGCYFSAIEGKIVAYDKALEGSNGYIPEPASFRIGDWDTYAGNFYAYSQMDRAGYYIAFDAENLCFRAQRDQDESTYLYREMCEHSQVQHYAADAATCTEQGVKEYWYCPDCYRYYDDSALELPLEIYSQEEFNEFAFGHNYVDGVCVVCGMPRTYIPVTSLEQFDALNSATTYIIVIKDGEKTYAAALPVNPMEIDKNDNGIPDVAEPDENGNGIADCIEAQIDMWGGADTDEDGITTVEEYLQYIGDNTDDGVIDSQDVMHFFEMDVYWSLYYQYDEQMQNSPNFLEVTMNSDGTVTVTNDDAMEFQMVEGGVWGGQEAFEGEKEEYGILETERLRAAWIPNYWIGCSGQMGYYSPDHFGKQMRWYGDSVCPGMMDHKNWKISFREDGTACLVNTWEDFNDTGALQFAKYTDEEGNAAMTIVGMPDWLWTDSFIMQNRTELLPVYLYAAEPENFHTCEFGQWVADEDGRTHTHTCMDPECGKTETKPHGWDQGVQTKAPTCTEAGQITYTCEDCKATRTETVEELGHDWTGWSYDTVDSHIRTCKRGCGVEAETEGHTWGDWIAVDGLTHKMVCAVCQGEQTGNHEYGEGVVTQQPTEEEEGIKTFTCVTCPHSYTESIPKVPHVHTFGAWTADNDDTHSRTCRCGETETENHSYDEGVVVNWATHTAPGEKQYTCATCFHMMSQTLPQLPDHEWSDWTADQNGLTHSRTCECKETETEPHLWNDWTEVKENVFIRECFCGAAEQMLLDTDTSINVTPEDNAANGTLGDSDIQLIDKLLTDEEQSQVAQGADVQIYLKVEDISADVPARDQEAAEEVSGDSQIGMYLDIELFKKVNEEETQVTETSGKVTITIEIPETLRNNDATVNRIYTIIRVHELPDGTLVTETIQGVFDPEKNTFTFETDKFSTYALAYTDKAAGTPGDLNQDGFLNSDDVIALLLHITMPDLFELPQSVDADFTKDGDITSDDAILLLLHISMPDMFPLS